MSVHPMKLPEIRMPRLPEAVPQKLPEIKHYGSRAFEKEPNVSPGRDFGLQDSPTSNRPHSSPRAATMDPPSPKIREKKTSSPIDFTPKTKQKRIPTSLDSTPLSSPTMSRLADPPRKRSSSSSQVTSTSSTVNPLVIPAKTLAPVENPKRSSSHPLLPITGFAVHQLPPLPHHASVASVLTEEADLTIKPPQPFPVFAHKKPLGPRALTKTSHSASDIYDRSNSLAAQIAGEPALDYTPQDALPNTVNDSTHTTIKHDFTLSRSKTAGDRLEKIHSGEELHVTTQLDSRKSPTKQLDTSTSSTSINAETNQIDPRVSVASLSTHKIAQEKEEEDIPNTTTPRSDGENNEETTPSMQLRRSATHERQRPQEKPSRFQVCLSNLCARVFVGTWNMQGKPPPSSGLELFITPNTHDIYAIGTEECETTIQRALLSPPKQKWEDKLSSTLGPEYVMLPTSTLGAVHLAVFVHFSILPLITEVRTGSIPTGLGNVVANKGGVAVTFLIGTTSVAFVAAHFTAHHNKVEQRNADFHRINTMLSLSPPAPIRPSKPPTQSPSQSSIAPQQSSSQSSIAPQQPSSQHSISEQSPAPAFPPKRTIRSYSLPPPQTTQTLLNTQSTLKPTTQPDELQQKVEKDNKERQDKDAEPEPLGEIKQGEKTYQELQDTQDTHDAQEIQTQQRGPPFSTLVERFDRVFWFGDLNYRINGNKKIVEETVKQNLIEVLVANDQLTIEKKKGNIFQGFLEGPLSFVPTYKYDAGTDNFDTSAKARVPSWTDRILFKTTEHVTLDKYDSCTGLRYTDHRPVFASFSVGFSPPDPKEAIGSNGQPIAAGSKVCTIL